MNIAIVSPATIVNPEYIDAAVSRLHEWGHSVIVMPHAKGPACGSYAASLDDRLADFLAALEDPHVDAILCSRGGYGCVQLLPYLSKELISATGKILIGFSDVTALHALWFQAGVISIHGPMTKHISMGHDPFSISTIKKHSHPYDREGIGEGKLFGGNWAVISSLLGTIFDPVACDDIILFLEDISEPIYKVDRMLYQLYLSGAMQRLKGLVFGKFTNYEPDKNFKSMEDMLHNRIDRLGIKNLPIAFDFPIGHFDGNVSLPIGAKARLNVSKCVDNLWISCEKTRF